MKINELYIGQVVYQIGTGKRVTIRLIDEQSEYVQVEDNNGDIYDIHISKLQAVTGDGNMDSDSILEREG